MSRTSIGLVAVLAVAGAASSASAATDAFRGIHVGFDTAAGVAGSPLLLRTGYGTSGAPESEQWAFRFGSTPGGQTQLQTRTARYSVDPNAPWDQARYTLLGDAPLTRAAAEGGGASPVAGWFANTSLTSAPVTHRQTVNHTGADAFIAAGRLAGGDFAWEIVGVTPLNGSPSASFAMGRLGVSNGSVADSARGLAMTAAVNDPTARTLDIFGIYDASLAGGGALADRSVFIGSGNHLHGWGFFVSAAGEYEVAMRVYDVNGVYLPSETYTFQVNSIPGPGAAAVAGLGAIMIGGRRRRVKR